MARTADQVYAEVLELSDEERAKFMRLLEDDLDDFEISPGYQAELERRIAEIDAGTAELVSVEDALAFARAALDARTTSSRR
ncbi:MAG TPA: addiction module protein [Thermoanaerobaculia bacterium]|nr:addiction module protein [Thermoanaerobaculia bacterium]